MISMEKMWTCRENPEDTLTVSRVAERLVSFEGSCEPGERTDIMLNADGLEGVIAHLCAIRDEMRGEEHREAEAEEELRVTGASAITLEPGAGTQEPWDVKRVRDTVTVYGDNHEALRKHREALAYAAGERAAAMDAGRGETDEKCSWKPDVQQAIKEAASVLRLGDSSDYMNGLWGVLAALVHPGRMPDGPKDEAMEALAQFDDYDENGEACAYCLGPGELCYQHEEEAERQECAETVGDIIDGLDDAECNCDRNADTVPPKGHRWSCPLYLRFALLPYADMDPPRRHHSRLAEVMEMVQAEFVSQCARYGWPRAIFTDDSWREKDKVLPLLLMGAGGVARRSAERGHQSPLEIFGEEAGEVAEAKTDDELVTELVQTATTSMVWAQSIRDKRRKQSVKEDS
jgi:hypothetical protein